MQSGLQVRKRKDENSSRGLKGGLLANSKKRANRSGRIEDVSKGVLLRVTRTVVRPPLSYKCQLDS